jgi:hypothetical protein
MLKSCIVGLQRNFSRTGATELIHGMYTVSTTFQLCIRWAETGHHVIKEEYIKSKGSWIYSLCFTLASFISSDSFSPYRF